MMQRAMILPMLAMVALPPCPSKPNCVSTQATDPEHRIEPIHYPGSTAEALKKLRAIVESMARAKIVKGDATSIAATFTTLVFRFVDDALFVFDDDTKTLHFRSASRVGRSDWGVNRRRMEAIRKRFFE
jgi:uncharacterized protein (DUF1499 family)